jgi:hypothetical protein
MIGEEAAVAPVMFYRHTRVASDRINDGIFSANGLYDFQSVWLTQ